MYVTPLGGSEGATCSKLCWHVSFVCLGAVLTHGTFAADVTKLY
jgi:hypothetical protein